MDTTYCKRNFGVVIMKDFRTKKILCRKCFFAKKLYATNSISNRKFSKKIKSRLFFQTTLYKK